MGTHRSTAQRLLGFLGLGLGILALFGAVALAALRPVDGLAWVQVTDLGPDFRLDDGLHTQPLKARIVAEALRDRNLTAPTGDLDIPVVPPSLTILPSVSQPGALVMPTARPTIPPPPSPAGGPQPGGSPSPSPQASPSPSPVPTPAPTPSPTPAPTPAPTPTPPPAPTPTPASTFAIAKAFEVVVATPNSNKPCKNVTVTATGGFSTNGVGGTVQYEWVRRDGNGTRIGATGSLAIAPGDKGWHAVTPDQWTPATSGTEQLVFLYPGYSVAAQSWSCRG